MKEITGKSGTITFDVEAVDEQTAAAIETIVSGMLKTLVDKDSQNIRQMLVAKSKDPAKTSNSAFARENLEKPILLPIGGEWSYSVALTRDGYGVKSVQICKGRILGDFRRDGTGKMILDPDDPMDPITKANHINVKSLSEWTELQKPVITRLNALEE